MGSPSIGLVIGLPIAVVIIFLGVVFTTVAVRVPYDSYEDRDLPKGLFVGLGAVATLITALITAVSMYPFGGEYHHWATTSGTVATIDSRLLADGDAMTQRFVVNFTDGRQRACDDTRCASVHAGDTLTIKCKRSFQWSGTDGYDCNWVGVKHA